jgi:tetratricopeptide (TPR) repeat protein
LFHLVQQALGLRVASSLVTLLQTQPKIYEQAAVFDDVDIEDVGLRVKFLDVISNAQGYVFSKRAEQKEREGFLEAARALYVRAYSGFQAALNSCPNDSTLLRNCAQVMTKIFLLDSAEAGGTGKATLRGADTDNPLLFGARMNYKRAIQVNRKSPLFYASYASFLQELGETDGAEAHYLEALLRDPTSVATLEEYAKLLRQMGCLDDAEQFEKRARTIARSGVSDSAQAAEYL